MRQNGGKFAVILVAALLGGGGVNALFTDSSAQAGMLKNSVRVGDRSAMNIFKTPKPGERHRIRIHRDVERVARAPAPESQSWFWDQHHAESAAAAPGRWAEALASLQAHRAAGHVLFSEDRLRDIATRYRAYITTAARAHGLSEALLLAVIAVESAGRAKAVSPKGARGLMQLIPATAQRFGVADSLDPAQNISGGAAYLDWLLRNFGEDAILALAGYNAGEGAVERYKGVPPYSETRDYVVKVFDALAAAGPLCRSLADTPRQGCGWTATPPG